MPWRSTDSVKERTKFILEWEQRWEANEGQVNVSALCREFGVSRDSGHRWIRRYQAANRNLSAVIDRSHRPATTPTKVDDHIEDLVVAARKAYPRRGPKKIRSLLVERYAALEVPAPSTIGEILKRRGLSQRPVRRRRRSTPFSNPCASDRAEHDMVRRLQRPVQNGGWEAVLSADDPRRAHEVSHPL